MLGLVSPPDQLSWCSSDLMRFLVSRIMADSRMVTCILNLSTQVAESNKVL